MANRLILKRSSVAGKIPLATDLSVGEIAVNLADQKLYSKNASGTVILVGSSAGTVEYAQAYNSASVSGATTATSITFGGESFDSGTMWVVGSPTRITVPTATVYNVKFSAQVSFTSETYVLNFLIYKNGVAYRSFTFRENWRWFSGDTLNISFEETVSCAANDYFEIYHYGDSNGYSIGTTQSTRAHFTVIRV